VNGFTKSKSDSLRSIILLKCFTAFISKQRIGECFGCSTASYASPRLLLGMGRGPGGGSSTYKIGAVPVYRHDQFKRRTTAVPNNNNN